MKQYFLKYSEFLNESLSSARKKFLNGGLISQAVFDILSEIDPTPTKKYLEKMCAWWRFQDNITFAELSNYIKKFHTLLPILEEKDINKYGSYELFKITLDSIESKTAMKKAVTKDIEVVFETEDVQVTHPKTYEQSCVLGAGTKWCTASFDTKQHWVKYTTEDGITFYYIWFKKVNNTKFYKIAVGVNDKNEIRHIYDAEDEFMYYQTLMKLLEEYSIPRDIFVTKVDVKQNFEEALKHNDKNVALVMLKNHEILQTRENFDRLVARDISYGGVMYLIEHSKNFQDEYYFDTFLKGEPTQHHIYEVIRDVREFRQFKYFDKIKNKVDDKSMGGIIVNIEEFQTKECFDVFMSKEPSSSKVAWVIREVKEFQQEYYMVRYIDVCNPLIEDVLTLLFSRVSTTDVIIKRILDKYTDGWDFSKILQQHPDFQTMEMFRHYIKLKPRQDSVAGVIYKVNTFQNEECFQAFMESKPNETKNIEWLQDTCSKFKEWYEKNYNHETIFPKI